MGAGVCGVPGALRFTGYPTFVSRWWVYAEAKGSPPSVPFSPARCLNAQAGEVDANASGGAVLEVLHGAREVYECAVESSHTTERDEILVEREVVGSDERDRLGLADPVP